MCFEKSIGASTVINKENKRAFSSITQKYGISTSFFDIIVKRELQESVLIWTCVPSFRMNSKYLLEYVEIKQSLFSSEDSYGKSTIIFSSYWCTIIIPIFAFAESPNFINNNHIHVPPIQLHLVWVYFLCLSAKYKISLSTKNENKQSQTPMQVLQTT